MSYIILAIIWFFAVIVYIFYLVLFFEFLKKKIDKKMDKKSKDQDVFLS